MSRIADIQPARRISLRSASARLNSTLTTDHASALHRVCSITRKTYIRPISLVAAADSSGPRKSLRRVKLVVLGRAVDATPILIEDDDVEVDQAPGVFTRIRDAWSVFMATLSPSLRAS